MRTIHALFLLALLASSLFAANATTAYVNNAASGVPKIRFWNSAGAGTWGSEINLPSTDSTVQWTLLKYSPVSQKMLLVTLSSDGWLDAYVCLTNCQTNTSWVVTNNIGDVANAPAARKVDIAFETATGDALVIYAVNSTDAAQDLAYKVLPAGSTSFSGISEQYIDDGSANGGGDLVYTWVVVARNPVSSSKEILLAGFDSSGNDINAWVWDGSAWGNQQELAADATACAGGECLAVEYSADGSDGMVIGSSGTSGKVFFQYWTGGGWNGAGAQIFDVGTNDFNFMTMKADPATDDLLFLGQAQAGILYYSYYNGATWTTNISNIDTITDGTTTKRSYDFVWNNTGSIGYLVWERDTTGTTLSTRNWTGGNWKPTVTISTYRGTGAWLNLYRNPTSTDTTKLLGLRLNNTFQIEYFNRTETTFSTTGTTISATATSISYEAFSLSFHTATDTTAPSVGNTSSNASSVATNSIICVNATATDAAGGISIVKSQIRYPDGSYANVTLSDTGCNAGSADDGWWGAEVNVGASTGTLTINTTFANDTFNNVGFQSPYPNVAVTVEVAATPPTVGNISVNASGVYTNVSICVNATASDGDGISMVWTEVRYPNGTYANVTMSDTGCNAGGGGDTWYGIAINVGNLSGNFFVNNTYANDTLGASANNSSSLLVTVQAPSVGNTSVNISTTYAGAPICVNATVTDTSGVSAVWAQVRFPNGTFYNLSMSDTGCNAGGGGDGWWGVSINASNTTGTLTVNTTYANDSFNNIGYQSPFPNLAVTVQAPSVGNTTVNATTVNISTSICVNATAVDTSGISAVWTQVRYPDGTYANATMSDTGCNAGGAGDGRWGAEVSVGASAGTLTVNTTYANDSFNNIGYQSPFPDLAVIVQTLPPTHSDPILNSTYGTNYTYENLTCYNQSTLYSTANSYDWRANGTSIAVLDMTFNKNVSSTETGAVYGYSTYENNGTLTGGATVPVWNTSGKIGGSYIFDGVDDYILVPHSASLSGDGTRTQMTLEAWVRPNVSNHNGHILTKRNTSSNGSFQFGLDGTVLGKLFCLFYYGPNDAGSYTEALAGNAGNPSLIGGVWYHIVCTYKNGTGIRVYVNGTLVNVNTTASGDGSVRVAVGTPVRIGARGQPVAERFFNGSIDEVRIYDRALSDEEIANHYNLGQNMLLSNELGNNTSYTCAVTPTDGTTDGTTKTSNALVARNESLPTITIVSPQNGTYNASSVLINISSTGVFTWYQYNGTNYTYTAPEYRNFSDGGNLLQVWSNNSLNQISSANVSFSVNTAGEPAPTINIISPQNTTYYNATILINISSNGVSTWYQYNGTNYTYSSPEYRNFSDGGNIVRVWSNNTQNNISYANVSFSVDAASAPIINITSPQNTTHYNATILINISSTGVSTWYQYNGTNYTYTAPEYRNFSDGGNIIRAWSNSSTNNISYANVSFWVNTTPSYNDIVFNSSFQSGNLYNVTFVSGDAGGNRLYNVKINYSFYVSNEYHWWFFFKMTGANGKNIRINITNPTTTDFSNDRWPNVRPRYSYDFGQGNVDNGASDWSMGNWSAVFPDSISYSQANLWFSFNISATSDTVWVSSLIPYTVLRRDRYLASLSSPYVNITNLGTTSFGLNLTAVEVTDTNYPAVNKKRVYLIGNQHANEEAQGSWEIEGAINFLLNDTNATAATLRQNYRFKFVPIVNVDGVYNGTGRFSPYYNNSVQWDPNREWDNVRTGNYSVYFPDTVNWTYADIAAFAPNASLDLHGSMNGEQPTIPAQVNYFLLDKAADSVTNAFAGNLSAKVPYVFSTWTVVTNPQSMPVNVYSGLGVHPSFTFEFTASNVTPTLVPNNTHWVDWGKGILEGVHGYFGTTGNSVPNVSLVIPANGTATSNTSLDFGCNVSSLRSVLSVTFYLWNSTSLWLNTTQTNATGFANGTQLNFSAANLSIDSYNWNCRAVDNLNGSAWASNFSLSIIVSGPYHETPILNSTYGTNFSSENLTCYNQSTLNANANTFDWRLNGTSLAVLDMTFNTNNSENATDYSTFENNGTLGNTTPTTEPNWTSEGKIGGAYTFDGVNDRIKIPHSSSFDGGGNMTEFTLEAWIYPAMNASSGIIIAKRWSAANGTFQLGFDSTYKGKMFCYAYFTSGSGTSETLAQNASNPNLTVGAWYHTACTYKNGTGLRFYVNGSLVNTNASSGSGDGKIRTAENANVTIGARGTNVSAMIERFFNGTIDEVKMYNRSLSDAEITSHFLLGYNKLLSNELSVGSSYTCAVTPSNGTTDGTTKISNALIALNESGTIVDTSISAGSLSFGSLNPGTSNNAATENPLVLTNTANSNVAIDVYLNNTNMTNASNSIPYFNLSVWVTNNAALSTSLNGSTFLNGTAANSGFVENLAVSSTVDLYFWQDVPASQAGGAYTAAVSIHSVANGEAP